MQKIIRELTGRGYRYQKDVMGHYFDRGDIRITITQTGPVYNCFKNKLVNRQFKLIDKKLGFLSVELCWQWILTHL